ncbi:Ubx5 protein [Candida orthopsilosis Co 90-125]|uniref:Ubx5 protein n=1 Tax=Candida orthopsilosis (strain 90-125) TaxID=1136231 RepID=H8WX31_CANO9|nr:Ubx5 protein [Candida orthopsilosis Co 90-125]CCG21171.1 Ubx5 protein [Candida orthopsilosis Co 90-125]
MDDQVPTFLAVTGVEDESVATQFLDVAGGDLELAVTLYMESGQHGGGSHNNGSSNNRSNNGLDDEAYAQQLQEQAYGGNDVREADTTVHRHDTLVDSFPGFGGGMMGQMPRPPDIFGQRQQGIFHQGFNFNDRSINAYNAYDDDDDDEIDEDYTEALDANNDVQILDSDEENDEDVEEIIRSHSGVAGRRRRLRQERDSELTSTQRRLANLFRPPFDIISILTLDQAREKAKEENKWILINIQDSSEFQSQVFNRDFWSNSRIKQIVKENFIFLQYQRDSYDGETYANFYRVDTFPHLAILDPLTGERVRKWKDGEVPEVGNWLDEVYDFLDKFSLHPDSNNPLIQHETKIDPDSMSEEQQIELAMKQSVLDNAKNGKTSESAINLISDEEEEEGAITTPVSAEQAPQSEEDLFNSVQPIDHKEPSEQPTTRVQIRFPNGKRLVRKLLLSDKVVVLFQWLKFVLQQNSEDYGLSPEDRFTLSNSSNKSFKFIENLGTTIEEANLKNASILLEKE